MLFILCPYCHARIEIDEAEAAGPKARLSACCTDCGEGFFIEGREVVREPEPQAAVRTRKGANHVLRHLPRMQKRS